MKKSDLKKYAKLIVRMGANVQKGQEVVISTSVEDAYFVPYLVEECYKAKAKKVTVEWRSSDVIKLNYKYQKEETLTNIPNWSIEKTKHLSEVCPAMINVGSFNPDGMKGVDQKKMMAVQRKNGEVMKPYRDAMDGKYQWTIAALAGEAWAKKVFPDASKKEAVNRLWEAIFSCARVNGDPVENWKKHNENLISKGKKLDSLKIKTLKYKASNGTDFSIDLLPNTHFIGGGELTTTNVYYNPNMPTEECFNSPDKFSANGTLYASKPLSIMGQLVDKFGFKFEKGKVVEVIAENPEHKKTLENFIAIDEGASYLGEVALVPFDSPINQTGLLFYNTLFDENACCHFALGRGFSENINNSLNLTPEEIKAVGINESFVHCDFMIGTADLSIVAICEDGHEEQIFVDGNWAF